MAGFSTTGLGLPATTTGYPAGAGAPAASSTTPQPGFRVSGRGGSTTLPPAAPADFHGTVPTPLDQPHPTYPTLIQSHVAVLQAIGTPEAIIASIAGQQPDAAYLDRYIQGEIMQNPEGWDDVVGSPRGTARAGLQQLGIQPAPAGAGTPGYLPDGSTVSGINVPGLSTPLLAPSGAPATDGNGLVKGIVLAAAAVGVGVLGWKLLGSKGSKDPAKLAAQAFSAGAVGEAAAAGGGALGSLQHMGRQLMEAGAGVKNVDLVNRGAILTTLGSSAAGTTGATSAAATAYGVLHGLAPGDGYVQSISAAAKFAGISETLAHRMSSDNRWLGVLEKLAGNGGTLGDAATAGVLSSQALRGAGESAAAGSTQLAGLRQMFAGAANALA